MAVLVLGEFVRVRWREADEAVAAELERPGLTARDVDALLDGAEAVWGLVPGQEVRLRGRHLRERPFPASRFDALRRIEATLDQAHAASVAAWTRTPGPEPYLDRGEHLHLLSAAERAMLGANPDWDTPHEAEASPPPSPPAEPWAGPGSGRWLVAVQNAAHCWAALRGVGLVVADAIGFEWTAVYLPGAELFTIGRPIHPEGRFELVYPPSEMREVQAALGHDGRLRTAPFQAWKGGTGVSASPVYRYGVLDGGVTRWLDLKPGPRPVTATPVTALFRARLELFRRELASRGVYYEDDAEERGYEARWALEDCVVPSGFHEPDAPQAYTVSGEGAPEDDKRELAEQAFDPDGDLEVDWLRELGTHAMPARVDVSETTIFFCDGKIASQSVTMQWVGDVLACAAEAAGLTGGGHHPGWRTTEIAFKPEDEARPHGAAQPPELGWNTVDAADRVQRAAYVLATGGTPDPEVEAALSRARGPIVRALLGRGALTAAEAGDERDAAIMVAELHPLAPGPFPRRAYAVIDFADALADPARRVALVSDALDAIADPLEQRLALVWAERAADGRRVAEPLVAGWAGDRSPGDWADATRRWALETVEPLLGPLDPPDAVPVEEDTHARLTRLAERGPAEGFAAAWCEVPAGERDELGGWLLRRAVASERFDVADLLAADGVPVSRAAAAANNALGRWGGETPLADAIEAGSLAAVRWCLERGVDPAAAQVSRGRTPDGADVHWPTSAVVLAAKHGRADILAHLLAIGGDPVSPIANGITPLVAAAYGGSIECVELLLATSAQADQPPAPATVTGGPEALTPLLYACDRGHDAVVRLLLDRGANPRVARADGELPLQLAMEGCALETLEALVAAGADAAAVNRHGLSVLHTAVLKGRADVLPRLLAEGAPIDLPADARGAELADTTSGWTALMIAAARGDAACVASLLDAGADPLITDEGARTALDLARLAADPYADDDPYDPVIGKLVEAEQTSAA